MNSSAFRLRWIAETSDDGATRLCRVLIRTELGVVGDPEAWSVVGLVQKAVDDLVSAIERQPVLEVPEDLDAARLFVALRMWNGHGRRPAFLAEDVRGGLSGNDFRAIPTGAEIFDGEIAYLVRTGPARARLLWRDWATGEIREVLTAVDAYVSSWQDIRAALEADGTGTIPATSGV
ncbi:hypothetical protein [Stackebrandtia soli]|uniref:hypothetical protein n=1 Tax=Stackebrandtia soli TaxID=1892856 RepID=UPI0039E95D47